MPLEEYLPRDDVEIWYYYSDENISCETNFYFWSYYLIFCYFYRINY